MATSMPVHVQLGPFEEGGEPWPRYLERLEIALEVHSVEPEKKKFVLLHSIGSVAYSKVRDLLQPDKPTEKSYEELVQVLTEHYAPVPGELAELFKFYKRIQREGETIADFAATLRNLSTFCNFGAYLNKALRNQFMMGLRDEHIQNKLMDDKAPTFEKCIKIARSMERTKKDISELRKETDRTIEINKIQTQQPTARGLRERRVETSTGAGQEICFRCGNRHKSNECWHKDTVCAYCQKKGHLKAVCLANPKATIRLPINSRKPRQAQVKTLEEMEEEIQQLQIVDIMHVDQWEDERDTRIAREKITLMINIENKEVPMELDSGSGVSIMSKNNLQKLNIDVQMEESDVILRDFNKTIFKPMGKVMVKVSHKGQTVHLPLYIVDKDRDTLLGREWLRKMQLNWSQIHEIQEIKEGLKKLTQLKQKYEKILRPGVGKLKGIQARLQLTDKTVPIFKRPRQVPLAIRQRTEEEIDRLESLGIISRVLKSEWATPIVPVIKGNGNIRLCADFKVTVNQHLIIPKHNFPKIDDLLHRMSNASSFTKIDLSEAYLHMEVRAEDRHLLTINTQKGLYQFNRLPYGIASAPALWQAAMEQVLQGIPYVDVFYDDIKIAAPTESENLECIERVFKRFEEHGLHINEAKSSFMEAEIDFLGFHITRKGIGKTKKLLQAIEDLPRPVDVTGVQHALGLINYYRRFVPRIADKLEPLHELLRKQQKFTWLPRHETAFRNIKEELMKDTVLVHFDPDKPLVLATDASQYGISAVLSHVYDNGEERPLAMTSRTLTTTEKKYSTIDREALAIYEGVKKLYTYLYGRRFTLLTDHRPLVSIFGSKHGLPAMAATRLQHYAMFLQAFIFDIRYRPASMHGNVDALSRLPCTSEEIAALDSADLQEIMQIQELPVSAKDIAEEMKRDEEFKLITIAQSRGLPTPKIPGLLQNNTGEWSMQMGCLLRGGRVVLPSKFRRQVMEDLHTGHPGTTRMKELARSHVWWPGIDGDIEEMVRGCDQCQEVQRNPSKAPTQHWSYPSAPMERIHVDFAGPIDGMYFMIIVDAFSKWPEVVPMRSITSGHTISALRHFFASAGLPIRLVTDNGPQFTSEEFTEFMQNNGIRHKTSVPYHPASNGQAERYVQMVKRGLKTLRREKGDVQMKLDVLLMAYRRTPHSVTGETPARMFMGRQLRSRLDLLMPDITAVIREKQEKKEREDKRKDRQLEEGQAILFRKYGGGQKWGSGHVREALGTRNYLVEELRSGRLERRHIEQIQSRQEEEERNNQNKEMEKEKNEMSSQDNAKEVEGEESAIVRRSNRTIKKPERMNL